MAEFRSACIRRFAKNGCISRPAISARVLRPPTNFRFILSFKVDREVYRMSLDSYFLRLRRKRYVTLFKKLKVTLIDQC